MSIETIINGYVAWRYKEDIASARFKALPLAEQNALLDKARRDTTAWFARTIERIKARDVTLLSSATFHPDNRFSRQLFTLETGIELPATVSATYEVVADYIGRDKLRALEEDRARAERAKQDEAKRLERVRLDAIAAKIAAGQDVTGDELADCAKYLGVELHPRTIGTLRKRVVSINADGARCYRCKSGKAPLSSECYRAYIACATAPVNS